MLMLHRAINTSCLQQETLIDNIGRGKKKEAIFA